MKILEIEGVSVSFPFPPYACQEEFMRQVLCALHTKSNALLESPTGTGKTLSLLCSVLAYQAHSKAKAQLSESSTLSYADYLDEDFRPRPMPAQQPTNNAVERAPTIIYASRTHSQLAQVVKELRRTVYRPRMNLLGSREQLCQHPKIKLITSNTSQAAICRQTVMREACAAFKKKDMLSNHLHSLHSWTTSMHDEEDRRVTLLKDGTTVHSVPDLEDIARMAQSHEACGYYGARERISEAELVLLPYNYLLDPKTSGVNIDLKNAIVIIDEAHNIESSCLDSVSLEISLKELQTCLEELEYFNKAFGYMEYADSLPILAVELKKLITGLIAFVDNSTKPYGDIFSILQRCGGVTFANCKKYYLSFQEVKNRYLEHKYRDVNNTSTKSHMQSLLDLMLVVFKDACNPRIEELPNDYERQVKDLAASYRIHVVQKERLCYWCFNPGIVMQALKAQGVRSILLASGTLAPLPALECDLQLPFAYQLENEHIITDDQLLAVVLRSGPSRVKLTSSFEQRENELVRSELGLTLVNLLPKIPQGVLVFFPSYTLLEGCVSAWTVARDAVRPSLIQSIKAIKKLFIEPKNKNDLPAVMRQYSAACRDGSAGAVLFAVARGKVSEGIDFTDGLCRAVIVTGIPFPPLKDPRVLLKREYLDGQKQSAGKKNMLLTRDVWYTQQAARAVNQAIGRVIRHAKDFGAIILLDERFADERNKRLLSKWVRSRITTFDDINMLPLAPFFAKHSFSAQRMVEEEKVTAKKTIDVFEPKKPDENKKTLQLLKAAQFFSRASNSNINNPISNAQPLVAQDSLPKKARVEEASIIDLDIMKSWTSAAPPIKEVPLKPIIVINDDAMPVEKKPTEKSGQVKEYLQLIKSFFNPKDYKEFCDLLVSYRKKVVSAEDLVPKLKDLFKPHTDAKGRELFIGFKAFVPPDNQHFFNLESSIEQVKKDAAHNLTTNIPTTPIANKENVIGTECPICRDLMKVPYKAKCGHVCCYSCWTSWLIRVLECPICRNRTRLATLSPISTANII